MKRLLLTALLVMVLPIGYADRTSNAGRNVGELVVVDGELRLGSGLRVALKAPQGALPPGAKSTAECTS